MVHHLLPLSSLFYDLDFSLFFPIDFIFFYFHYFKSIFKITFFDIANELGPLIQKQDIKYSFVISVEVRTCGMCIV
jgi:hypothetical protein